MPGPRHEANSHEIRRVIQQIEYGDRQVPPEQFHEIPALTHLESPNSSKSIPNSSEDNQNLQNKLVKEKHIFPNHKKNQERSKSRHLYVEIAGQYQHCNQPIGANPRERGTRAREEERLVHADNGGSKDGLFS